MIWPKGSAGSAHTEIAGPIGEIGPRSIFADYRGGVTCLYDTQLLAPACTHPSAVAALALRPSGACQTYQSPPSHRAPGGVGGCRLGQPSLFQQGVQVSR